jgi:hypothetical protein
MRNRAQRTLLLEEITMHTNKKHVLFTLLSAGVLGLGSVAATGQDQSPSTTPQDQSPSSAQQNQAAPAPSTNQTTPSTSQDQTTPSAQQNQTTPSTPTPNTTNQGTTAPNQSMPNSSQNPSMNNSSTDESMMTDENMLNESMPDPMAINYPFAGPGTIDMRHFHSYRGMTLMPGTATEARYHRDRMQDEMNNASSIKDNEEMADPAPINYPFAGPGTVDMMHFHTYRGINLMPGSPTDERFQQQTMKDQTPGASVQSSAQGDTSAPYSSREERSVSEDQEIADPAPINYPFAAPGTIDMAHFHTYRGITLEPGSVTEKQYEQQKQNPNRAGGNINAGTSGAPGAPNNTGNTGNTGGTGNTNDTGNK